MRTPFPDAQYPADPYPGAAPACSFVHLDGTGHPLRATPTGWEVEPDGLDLDQWLAGRGAAPLAERIPVLAYGSNRCPSKITWLRHELGLAGPAVVLRAACTGLSAVWATGLRARDGARPATLAAVPQARETHAVWMATPDQVSTLDVCEGRGTRFRLVRLHTGQVRTENGQVIDSVLTYVAASAIRDPLLVDGEFVRCADTSQAAAVGLRGEPGPNGLTVTEVTGQPHSQEWPDRVFVYGTLQPGGSAWPLIEPLVGEPGWPTTLPGTLYDTGLGYPGLRPDGAAPVPGWVLPLADPVAALRRLDEYEGPDYRRMRVGLPGGTVCWTYVFQASVLGMRVLPRGWTGSV